MKMLFLLFLFLIGLNVYSQDTTFVKKLSKRYAYLIEIYSQKQDNIIEYNVILNEFYVNRYDTLNIYLKDLKENKIIPFAIADSAVVEGGYPFGVPRNLTHLSISKEGAIIFIPAQISDYQNLIPRFGIIPSSEVLTHFINTNKINSPNNASKIMCYLYRNISKKMSVPMIFFELFISCSE